MTGINYLNSEFQSYYMGAPKGRIPWDKGIKRGPCPWVSKANKNRTGIWKYAKRLEFVCLNCNHKIILTPCLTKKRKFCSRKCYFDFYKGRHPLIKTGEWCYRNIAFRNFDRICQICGKTNNLIIHHKDRNHKNNNPKNLMPLCPEW